MTENDKPKFASLVGMLSEAFSKEVSKLKTELYFGALKDYSINEVVSVVYTAIETLKFFPTIAELREFIESDPDSQSLLAWQEAVDTRDYYHGAQFEDPIIHYCIQEIFGTYMDFCEKTLDELKWEEKRFIRLYKLALRRPDLVERAPKKMLGMFQVDNEKKGFLEYVPEVRKHITPKRLVSHFGKFFKRTKEIKELEK